MKFKASLVFYTLFLGALVFFSVNASLGDFANYYFGAWLLQKGQFTAQVFDVASFNALIYKVHPGLFLNHSTLPPLSAVLFWPLSFFEVQTAKLLFNAISLLIFGTAVIRIARHLSFNPLFLVLFLTLPILSNLQQGQVYLLLFACLSEGYLALTKNKLWLTAMLWSFAIVFKLFPAFLLVYLLLEKRYKSLLYTCIGCLLWVGVSLPFVPLDTWLIFAFDHIPRLLQGEINDPFSSTYQTFGVWVNQLFVHNDIFNPNPWKDWPLLASILKFAFQLKLLFIMVLASKKMASSYQRFALVVFFGFFLSGYGSTYSLVFLGLVVIGFFQIFTSPKRYIVFALLFVASSLPIAWYVDLGFIIGFSRLWMLLVVIIIVTLHFKLNVNAKHYLIFISVLTIFSLFIFRKNTEKVHYVSTKKSDILITDFTLENQLIITTSYSEKGYTQDSIKFSYEHISLDAYQPNYFGPLYLVDSSYYLMLSDQQRGIGFTAIRKLPLDQFYH